MSAQRLVRALLDVGVDVLVIHPVRQGTEASSSEDGGRLSLIALPATDRWSLLLRLHKWRRHVRVAVERSEAAVVHGQGLLPGGIAATDVRGIPRVITAHGNLAADNKAFYKGLGGAARTWLRNRLSISAINRADAVIGVNPDWHVNLPRRSRRFVYIPNIVDERFYTLRRDPDPALVLFAGGARAIKGWPLLAAAWPAVRDALPEARLHLAGWPSDAARPDVGRTHQVSLSVEAWMSSEDLAAQMARASLLVIPSEFEVSPIVLAEAWALGLPVVVTAVGGLFTLADGAAVLVHQREPEALAAAIVDVLAGGAGVQQLVEEGRRRAEAHRAKAVAEAHLALYTELVEGGAK